MGKARIVSDQGEGLYTIEILEDRTRAESQKAQNQDRVTQIASELIGLDADLAAAQADVDTAAQAQDAAIDAYQALVDSSTATDAQLDAARKAMTEAVQAIIEAAHARDAVRLQISQLKLERLSRETQIERVNALPDLRQQDAWCADYTEELAGEVATAEVPGEIGQVIIQPGYDGDEVNGWPSEIQGGATWSAEHDGAIQPALSGTPASVFYNLAMLPGWQKWCPTFRTATITGINEDNTDLVNISLDAATSSQQALDVNAQSEFIDVPVYYMECNGAPFEQGDKVLVAFGGNVETPMVVGFASEPKPCGPEIMIVFNVPHTYKDYGPDDYEEMNDGTFRGYHKYEEHLADLLASYQGKIDRGRIVIAILDGTTNNSLLDTWHPHPDWVTFQSTPTHFQNFTLSDYTPLVESLIDIYGKPRKFAMAGWGIESTEQDIFDSLVASYEFKESAFYNYPVFSGLTPYYWLFRATQILGLEGVAADPE